MTRPFYSSNFDTSNKSTGYALIVIDNSLSMHDHIDSKLKNTIRKIVDPLNDKFKVHIVTLDNLEDVYSGLKKNIEIGKLRINKTSQNTNLDNIFKYALSRKNIELNRYLFILSDGQVNNQIENNSDLSDLEDWNITYVNMGKLDVNVAVYNISTNSNFISTNNKFTINADLLNNGNTFIENNLIELYINEVNIGKQYIDIDEDELATVSFQLSLPENGAYKGYIKSQHDDREEDNIFYFSLNVTNQINVDIIDESNNIFLKNLLNSFNLDNDFINYKTYSLDTYLSKEVRSNILFILGMKNFNSNLLSKLNNIPEFDSFKIITFPVLLDSSLSNFSSFIMGLDTQKSSRVSLVNKNYLEIDYTTINNKFINRIFKNNSKRNIKVFNYLDLDKSSETLISLNNNKFLLNRYKNNKLEFLLFSISLDLKSSNFPLKGNIIPLFKNLLSKDKAVHYISTETDISTHYDIANSIITSPTGQSFSLNSNSKNKKLTNVGFYSFNNKNKNSFFGVNYDSLELKNKFITNDKILKNYLPNQTEILNNEDNIQESMINKIVGYELWTFFLILVLVLLILEMLIVTLAPKNE